MNFVLHVLILVCMSPVLLVAMLLYLLVVVIIVFPCRCVCGVPLFDTYISWLFWPMTLFRDALWYKYRVKTGRVLYVDLVNQISSKCLPPTKELGTIRFVCISDTHEKHWLLDLPEGDVLIHCGDILFQNRGQKGKRESMAGEQKLIDFNNYLATLTSFSHKIVIAGNHDSICSHHTQAEIQSLLSNCIYLDNQLTIVRGLRIYGSPHSRVFGSANSAFQLEPGELSAVFDRVPTDLDVLMTHVGRCCKLTEDMVARVQPKVHVFGHFHKQYGVDFTLADTVSMNASSLNGMYAPTNLPVVFDMPVLSESLSPSR